MSPALLESENLSPPQPPRPPVDTAGGFSEGRRRHPFTRAEYYFLAEAGMLDPDRRYELLDGDILEIMGQKQPHNALVMLWLKALSRAIDLDFLLCQLPVVFSDTSELEPDLAVLQRPSREYINGDNPPASDLRMIVEIAVTSLAYDMGAKARKYAQAGVPDYWVEDVEGRRIVVHRDPTPEGYASILPFSEEETVSPLAAPNVSFRVGDFLP